MIRILHILALPLLIAGCVGDGTNPFDLATTTETPVDETPVDTTTTTTDTGMTIQTTVATLPGTTSPTSNNTIFRREAQDTSNGNGYAEGFAYDADSNTFFVDNLAFDGEGGYAATLDGGGNPLGVGPFNSYSGPSTAIDVLTGTTINQLEYRALYAVGNDGTGSIAIIRTGGYTTYGFGGYFYQRQGGVTLPTSGQAVYTGTNNYGGLRDFTNRGALEYVTGDAQVLIDFNDFNDGAGVRGFVTNRQVFDLALDDVTTDIRTAFGGGTTQLPNLIFEIKPGVLDANGELQGEIESAHPVTGDVYESGTYYAILSGENARYITGVIVVTGSDPRFADVTVRETGGFFAERQ
jgi:hypothetical protein